MDKQLQIKATDNTPSVHFNANSGILSIVGQSLPDDAESFFRPLVDWMEEYAKNPAEETIMVLDLDFFNISTSKRILFLLYALADMQNKGHLVNVRWHYRDGDIYEVGQDYAFMVKIPFQFIEQGERVKIPA